MPLGFNKATRRAAANSAASGGIGLGLLDEGFGGPGGDPLSSGQSAGTLLYTLNNPDTSADLDYFGFDVEFSPDGTNIVVAERYGDTTTTEGTSSIGRVHCFNAINGTLNWTYDGANAGDQVTDIAVTDNYVFVSHPEWDTNGYTRVGRVVALNMSNGSQAWYVTANTTLYSNKRFGWFVAANPNDDSMVAYETSSNGLYYYDSTGSYEGVCYNALDSGSTSSQLDGSSWGIIMGFANYDEASTFTWSRGDQGKLARPSGYVTFGNSVAVAGQYMAVSDAGWSSGRGRVSVFNTSNRSLARNIDNPATVNTSFGTNIHSVDIEDIYLTVGAYGFDNTGYSNDGRAYLFDASDGSEICNVQSGNPESNGYFGYSTASAFHRFAVAAVGENSNSGRVYVYSTGN